MQLLRRLLDNLGAPLSKEIKWSKEVVDQILKDGVLKYCQEDSDLVSKFEYGGSLYENLKTMGPDDGDAIILVALKAKKGFISFDMNEAHGYAVIKSLENSPYKEFSSEDGFLMPVKFKNWLLKLVNSAVNSISVPSVALKVSSSSAGVKVQIREQSKVLDVHLVPAFQLGNDQAYFVPPPSQHGYLPEGVVHDTAWSKSYTLIHKMLLKDMDKDHGCRHDLFKVVDTVLHRQPTFSCLTTLHLKTALLWYKETTNDWGKDNLGDRFTEFVGFLRDALQKKVLKHFWIKDLNLLTDIAPTTLENMHTRLSTILNSEQKRTKVLTLEA